MRGWMGFVMVAVLAGGGGAAAGEGSAAKMPFTVGKETTVLVGPLRADGSVDYVAVINEKYGKGVKAEENGFVTWLEAAGTGKDSWMPGVRDQVVEMCGGHLGEAMVPLKTGLAADSLYRARHGIGEMPGELTDYFGKVGPFLDRVDEATGKEKWWEPTGTLESGEVGYPWMGWWLRVNDDLAARAQWKWSRGDFDGFLAEVVAMKRLARAGGHPLLTQLQVSGLFEQWTGITVGTAASRGKMTAAQCAALGKALAGFGPLRSVADWEDQEGRWLELGRLERTALGKGPAWRTKEGDSVEFPREMLGEVDWDIVLKRANALIDERVAALKKESVPERLAWVQATALAEEHRSSSWLVRLGDESREKYSARVAGVLMAQAMGSEWSIDLSQRRSEMYAAMARTVVAAAAYKADKGEWPMKLADVVPGYLKAVPRDMYAEDGKGEVGYVVRDEGIEVYSIWENRRDDGGERGKDADDTGVGVLGKPAGG